MWPRPRFGFHQIRPALRSTIFLQSARPIPRPESRSMQAPEHAEYPVGVLWIDADAVIRARRTTTLRRVFPPRRESWAARLLYLIELEMRFWKSSVSITSSPEQPATDPKSPSAALRMAAWSSQRFGENGPAIDRSEAAALPPLTPNRPACLSRASIRKAPSTNRR